MINLIYKATNKVTREVYIGITKDSLEKRKKDHLQKANIGSGYYFQEAIRTYGPDAFSWEQVDTASDSNELAAKEKEYILIYNSIERGYNSDTGGGIKKNVYQYNHQTKELIQKYDSLISAASAVNATKQDISRACLGANGYVYGYFWSYRNNENFIPNGDSRKKGLMQLDMDSNVITHFDSVADASEETGLSKTCISRVCRGERDSSGGFIWRYLDK